MSVSRRRQSTLSSNAGGSADLKTALTLSYYKIGENRNISGFCTSGEVFCLLGTDRKEQSRLLSVMSGRKKEKPITLNELRRREAEAITTQQSASTNKIASRSRSNTVTRDYSHPMESSRMEDGRTDSYESLTQDPSNLNLMPGSVYLENEILSPSDLAASGNGSRLSYLEPNDIKNLYNDLTVLETLVFSSQMRQEINLDDNSIDDGMTQNQPAELAVLCLLTDMGFKDWAETKVGDLTKWQKRMVLFATEAVAGKDALFFDMPTLDLDAPSALALITALQRAAKGGRMVVVSMTSLTFREYAMLDKIQLLSSNGSIYFGSVSRAVNYFAGLGRTPSPGASISDFLLDLVDDDMWPGGYSDAHLAFLERAAERMAIEELSEVLGGNDSNDMKEKKGLGAYGRSSLDSGDAKQGRDNRSPEEEHDNENPQGTSFLSGLNSSAFSSYQQQQQQSSLTSESTGKSARFYEGSEEDMTDWRQIDLNLFASSAFLNQFSLCLWRAFVVRWRDMGIIISTWSYTVGLLVAVFLAAFSSAPDEGSGGRRERFLTMFPYLTTLLLNLWNDQCLRDRNIFSFERNRGYFQRPWMSVNASLIADVIVFHTIPPLLACCALYVPVGLRPTGEAFFTFTKTILIICMVAACLTRALFFTIDSFGSLPASVPALVRNDRDASRLHSVKASSCTVTLFTLFLFYVRSGTSDNNGGGDATGTLTSFVQACSFYYWGSNILFVNEFSDSGDAGADTVGDAAYSRKYADIDASLCARVLVLQLVIYVALASLAARFSVTTSSSSPPSSSGHILSFSATSAAGTSRSRNV